MKKNLQPLVKNTIETKHVSVKGKNDFSSSVTSPISEPSNIKNIEPIIKKDKDKDEEQADLPKVSVNDQRKKANRTQKMSDDVILKIDILKPFLKELEDMDSNIKPTINDMVDLLLENYVHTKLTTKQLEAYQSMYKMRFDQL